ncbi:MAG: flagellar biosynthesis protein FlhF [Butyrivibrio sp.]|jgi:flagellar biosynthesis protein FlhF|nr:flagellar biosynthesis protein FlhF [Butyrivibrio sp.]
MIIKKFTGKTENEATELAKKELGQNIVIMNVRPVKKEGFFSFLLPQKTEVTVALEEETEKPVSSVIQPIRRPVEVTSRSGGVKDEYAPSGGSVGDRLVRATSEGTLPPLKVGGMEKASSKFDESSVIEEKLDNLHSLLEQNILKPEKDNIEPSKDESKEEETTIGKSPISEETMSFIKLLYNTLLENEVDEKYANQLTDELEKLAKPNLPFEYTLANVYQKMVLKFGKAETIKEDNEGPIAEIFIGPTGVGKTTTIAKLASELYLNKKRKVALLTIDTYRIAAAEQLKTYASIMEIPFRVIYTVEEMRQAIEDFRDYDYLMIDTAGYSIHNDELKKATNDFISVIKDNMDYENFLVLSATTKYRDLKEIVDCYSDMVEYKLIFTKMDETNCAGNLYNIRMYTGAPMSYITNGQNVPDDIAVFDAQKSVKSLLGGESKEKR